MDDPTSWICWVEQFFDFRQTEEDFKLPMDSHHLEGESQMWYQFFKESKEVVAWESLKTAFHICYRPTGFDDNFGDLTKLQ